MMKFSFAVALSLLALGSTRDYYGYNTHNSHPQDDYHRSSGYNRHNDRHSGNRHSYGNHQSSSDNSGSDHDSTDGSRTHDHSDYTDDNSNNANYHDRAHNRCQANYIRARGGCTPCPQYAHSTADNTCECNFGFKWAGRDCVPNCGSYEVFTPGGGCKCIQGYNKYDGVNCERCPKHAHWEVALDRCQCDYAFRFDSNGLCVPDCKDYEVYTPGGGCKCVREYAKLDGVHCLKCPSRSYWENNEDRCKCEWGLVWSKGGCVTPKKSYPGHDGYNNYGYGNDHDYDSDSSDHGHKGGY